MPRAVQHHCARGNIGVVSTNVLQALGEENRLGTVLCQKPIHASVRYGRQDYEDGCGLHTAMLTESPRGQPAQRRSGHQDRSRRVGGELLISPAIR